MGEIAERALARVKQARDLVVGEIADDRGIDSSEGFHAAPGVVRWHKACSPGMIERGFEIGEHQIRCRPAPAYRLAILAVGAAWTRAPAPWPFRDRPMPIQEPSRGRP